MAFNIATHLACGGRPAPRNWRFLTESSPLGVNRGSRRSLDGSLSAEDEQRRAGYKIWVQKRVKPAWLSHFT